MQTLYRNINNRPGWYVRAAAISVAWMLLYYDVVSRLAGDWVVDENYSHGFLVPIVSAYILWSRRYDLYSVSIKPHIASGIILMLISVVMLCLGILGAELYLTRISAVLSIVSLVVYFAGYGWLRILAFPIVLLLFTLPVPAIIFNQIAFPLQLIASDYATRIIRLLGIPALREGNIIELAQMKLQVAEACSGIRSLVSMATVATIFVYFFVKSWWRRIVLLLMVIPVAIFANAARVAGTGIIAHYRGTDAAEGFFHGFAGWLVFIVEILLLILVYYLLDVTGRIGRWRGKGDRKKY